MNLPSSSMPPQRGATLLNKSPKPAAADAPSTPPSRSTAPAGTTTPTKSKRVRTGCLTCRERHLKCDEGLPDCVNCRKSNRECKRGVRLNFIDVQVRNPPYMPPTVEWSVQFQDESRQIASEYMGGLSRYAHLNNVETPSRETDLEAALRRQAHQQRASRPGSTDVPRHIFDPLKSASMQISAISSAPSGVYSYPSTHQPADSRPYDGSHVHTRSISEAVFIPPHHPPSRSNSFSYSLQPSFPGLRGDVPTRSHAHKTSDASSAASIVPQATVPPPIHRSGGAGGNPPQDGLVTPPPSEKAAAAGEREFLNSPEELLFMQVFVEEVGVWMDSLDKEKHFSRLIPYHSLKSPMLLNAFLACGVKHLTLVNQAYKDDKALFYYDTATTTLLRSLQNPDRNTAECATTAVVLNVYEIMSEKPAQRMNHIAGARALIRECGWNAKSTGIGAACFWLNIGMEVLSCLAFNWQTSWDPDQWGLDMDFAADRDEAGAHGKRSGGGSEGAGIGQEEVWVHRILYIVAKIANFRATIPRFQEASPHDEQIRMGNRLAQWQDLKKLCDKWNNACPRTMHPFGYLYPSQTNSKSAFPNVWLIKRAAIIGRLFYHTAQCVLAQTNPMEPAKASEEMRALQLHHAHQVCGIVAHSKDRGVASVAIRSLAIASAVLTDPREQEEVLEILDKIHAESGWKLGKVHGELKKAWGWERQPSKMSSLAAKFFAASGAGGASPGQPAASAPAPATGVPASTLAAPTPMKALVNPLSFADFSLPNHPYQNWYEPPNRSNTYNTQPFL